jgi:hypothetical protein
MNKIFIFSLLFLTACNSAKKEEEIIYTPATFSQLSDWAEKKSGPRFIEVEGFLSPDAVISLFTVEKFILSPRDGGFFMPIEAKIMARSQGRNCVIVHTSDNFEYKFEDLEISLDDSTIIPFHEKVKLRGELSIVKNYCSLAVNEIVKAEK